MNAIAIIVSLIALVGAGFAFLRASSSHRILTKRIEKLKQQVTFLEEKLKRAEGRPGKGRREPEEAAETGRGRNQPRQEQQEQVREPRQKQRERQRDREPREERQREERQREERQRDREPQEKQAQQDEAKTGQQRRKRENRRRNEPKDTMRQEDSSQERQVPFANPAVSLEFAEGDLLAELEQAAEAQQQQQQQQQQAPAHQVSDEVAEQGGKRYAIIPEDGLIRQHQLQQRPDSDSYIEVDAPAEGSNRTHYRFNLAGNHAFVISQGIDRLENAFSFEKPSNRMVSQVVQQGDGVLARVGNGWKIEEKARIDFR